MPDDWNDLELIYRGLCRKDIQSKRRRIGACIFLFYLAFLLLCRRSSLAVDVTGQISCRCHGKRGALRNCIIRQVSMTEFLGDGRDELISVDSRSRLGRCDCTRTEKLGDSKGHTLI